MYRHLLVLGLVAALPFAQSARATPVNLVQNPGFEDGALPLDQSALTDWVKSTGPTDSVGGDNTAPHSGTRDGFLARGSLSQSLNLAGATYEISFYVAEDDSLFGADNPNDSLTVSLGGTTLD